jgi:hypothetical protein
MTHMGYGKHFSSMYTGSMVGSGALVFALMGYVIANMQPDKKVGFQVELNPVLLAAILGEKEDDVAAAIDFLCSPDPRSRSTESKGRRLERLGQFDFRVINGAKYRAIRDEEMRRESNRINQAIHRIRKKGIPLAGEMAYIKALNEGNEFEAQRILDQYSKP